MKTVVKSYECSISTTIMYSEIPNAGFVSERIYNILSTEDFDMKTKYKMTRYEGVNVVYPLYILDRSIQFPIRDDVRVTIYGSKRLISKLKLAIK